MYYRKEIDGLRALAVIPVVLFHANFSMFAGGFVGVDVFFVISGYLITSILLNEISDGSFSFLNFYERRARRILPPLFFMMIFCIPLAWGLMGPDQFSSFLKSVIAITIFSSNFLFAYEGNYFAAEVDARPLLHTWSLSVEEQYYFLFPILLILCRRLNRKTIVCVLSSLAVLSLMCAEWGWRKNPDWNFYVFPSRAWEILLGSLVAFVPLNKLRNGCNNNLKEIFSVLGLVLILAPIFLFDHTVPFPSLYSLFPTLGTALIILFCDTEGLVGKFLSFSLMVKVGLLSYSFYLWHQPVFTFATLFSPTNLTSFDYFLLICVSLILSYLSWKYIETPIRNKGVFKRNDVFKIVGLGNLFFFLIGTSALYLNVKPFVLLKFNLVDANYAGEKVKWRDLTKVRNEKMRLLIYGDSHARQYVSALSDLGRKQLFSVQTIMQSACMSLPNLTNIYKDKIHIECLDLLQELKKAAKGNSNPILIAYRWPKTIVSTNGQNSINGKDLNPQTQELYFSRVEKGIENLLNELGTHRKYILVGNVPSANLDKGYLGCLTSSKNLKLCHDKFPIEKGELFLYRNVLKRLAKNRPNILVLDPYEVLCDKKWCYNVEQGKVIYSDHAHLSVYGASKVIKYFEQEILLFLKN